MASWEALAIKDPVFGRSILRVSRAALASLVMEAREAGGVGAALSAGGGSGVLLSGDGHL
jgi:hypothetical protein